MHSLETTSILLYLAHGSTDVNCLIESADKLVQHFQKLGKDNLHFERYGGYDHGFNDQDGSNHRDEVIGKALEWLEPILSC